MYWRGNQESLELSFLKDLFPHKGKEFEQWVWSPVMMGYWILGYTQRRSCLWVKILPRQPNRDGRHRKQICWWSCPICPIWRYALVDTCGWVLSELHCHVGRGAAPAPPLQRSASKDPDIHISPNPHLASPHPTATSHFAAAVLRGWDYILWSLSLAILLLVGNCHDVKMKLWMVSFLKWYLFGKLSGRHIRTQQCDRTVVAGETDKLRAVSYPFKNMRKLTGTFLWRILPGAMFLWQQWSTKPGNFLNLHFTSNLTQIAYLTNYWRPGTKR